MAKTDQPARDENIAVLVDFFKSGIKDNAERLGIELEHTITKDDGAPVSYSGEHGVKWLLEQLSTFYPQAFYDPEGDILGVSSPGKAVTIEPAAQVELSAGPFTNLRDAEQCFNDFERQLSDLLEPVGAKALTVGYHPSARAADLELIPKQRYDLMNRYLSGISPFGVCMMRGSASTQISIDYTSEKDCLRKLRNAFALVPVFSLICDNAPVFEGKPRTHELVRTEVWQHCDPDRCGVVPHAMEESFSLESYASYILDTPAILVPGENGTWRQTDQTFGEIYATRAMTHAEAEHALSMFFTDVRLKTYIEIRPADAMPIPYVVAYAALVKGLFYCEESLCALDALFKDVTASDIACAKDSLMTHGYQGAVYGHQAADLAKRIVEIAEQGLAEEDRLLLKPLAHLVAAQETLASRAARS